MDGKEEARLLRQGPRVGDDGEGVDLQVVIVVEAQGLVLPHARIEDEAALLNELGATGVAGIEDRHVVGRG